MPRRSARHAQAVHADEVKANALLTAIKKSDVRKYLPDTRNDPADWKTGKSVEEIDKIKAAGGFVDLIQWRAHRSTRSAWRMTAMCSSVAIRDAGKDMFGGNADREDARAQVHVGREEGGLQVDHRRPVAQGRPFPDPRAECGAVRPECGLEGRRHDSRLRASAARTPRARRPTTTRSPAGRTARGRS